MILKFKSQERTALMDACIAQGPHSNLTAQRAPVASTQHSSLALPNGYKLPMKSTERTNSYITFFFLSQPMWDTTMRALHFEQPSHDIDCIKNKAKNVQVALHRASLLLPSILKSSYIFFFSYFNPIMAHQHDCNFLVNSQG